MLVAQDSNTTICKPLPCEWQSCYPGPAMQSYSKCYICRRLVSQTVGGGHSTSSSLIQPLHLSALDSGSLFSLYTSIAVKRSTGQTIQPFRSLISRISQDEVLNTTRMSCDFDTGGTDTCGHVRMDADLGRVYGRCLQIHSGSQSYRCCTDMWSFPRSSTSCTHTAAESRIQPHTRACCPRKRCTGEHL